ncbi:helix-turn-helix domain-containing protein [Pseudomonas sp. UL073]|uniref:Helix-turn-helix domain-containing protein n=1 Tax=Zestomonas insulae TaxID=2809017 RepID=A0ABS2IFE8_9GAMM|nr:AraC family transcriptional regulator [Pseudomonas insulae]MBM7061816.1 helix-turn-helix domain-containing protein [Pseudomonas insulae]
MQHEPLVTTAWPSTILSHAARQALPIDDLCARVGLSPQTLRDPSQQVPARLALQLFDECLVSGADAQFGCEMRVQLSTTCLQGLNVLLDSAATVGASLHCLVEFLPRWIGHAQPTLHAEGVFYRFTVHSSLTPHPFGLDSGALALVHNMARRAGRRPAELFAAAQITAEQSCGAQLESLGIPCSRGEHLAVLLPREVLSWPHPGANELLHQELRRTWQPPQATSHDTPAAERLHQARHWLRNTDQPLESIAQRAGYSSSSNFIRAFRSHYGMTPRQFRQRGA